MQSFIHPMIFGISFPNPFKMLAQAFQGAYTWQAGVIEKLVIGRDGTVVQGPLKELYLSNNNLAIYFAYAVFGMALILGVFTAKHRRIGEAFVVWAVVTLFTPQWVPFIDSMRSTSIDFSRAITSFSAGSVNSGFPMPDNWVVGTLLFGGTFMAGFFLAIFISSFEVMTALMAAWMMPFFALRAIGPRMKKLCNMVWAVGIVGVFLGRPVVCFFIEAGVWMMKTLPFGQTSFGGGVYIFAGYGMAFLAVFGAIAGCYHAVNAIDGRVAALASGTVAAFIRKTVRVDIAKLRNERPRPMPVVIVSNPTTKSDQVKKAAGDATKAAAKKAAIAIKHAATAAAVAA